MRILYLTDIHDALKELRLLFSTTEADLYLLSGDILYHAFADEAKVYDFVCLQEELHGIAREQKRDILPYDLATELLREETGRVSSALLDKATEYRLLFHRASRTMKEKYALIEDLIRKYAPGSCFVLPGNYDIDLRYTALGPRSLHKTAMRFAGLTFAGYGGAPIATSGIPEKLAVPYQETGRGTDFYSEPFDFFSETTPDILLLHNPAYGYFDRISRIGHVGSIGIRNYLDEHSALFVFSGHIHEDYGIMMKADGTILMNPSNFGGVDSPQGYQPGGLFVEVDLHPEERTVHEIRLKRLRNGGIANILRIIPEGRRLRVEREADAFDSPIDLDVFVRDSTGARL